MLRRADSLSLGCVCTLFFRNKGVEISKIVMGVLLAVIVINLFFFIRVIHPVIIVVRIVMIVIFIVLLIKETLTFFLVGYMIILIFLGGLMVLFAYISSVRANELRMAGGGVFFSLVVGAVVWLVMGEGILGVVCYDVDLGGHRVVEFFFRVNSIYIVIFLLFYLLFLMVLVVSLVGLRWGPLRVS